MIHILPSSIAFIGLLIASYTDIRTREVPDWLNYSLVAFGLSINLLLTVIFWDYKYIAASLLGFTAFFILALIMFYAGQWGGGDSKMLMGLGALLGLNIWSNEFPILASFLFNVLIFGAIYGLLWSFLLAYKHRK